MGKRTCFGFPDDMSLSVWHFKLGKCAIVIGRIWAILIFLIFACFSSYYVYNNPYTVHHSMFERPENSTSHLIQDSWSDYLKSCSGEKIIENQVHAAHIFSQEYLENIVEWDGYFIDFKNRR